MDAMPTPAPRMVQDVRAAIRRGDNRHTAGVAARYVQTNLVIVPAAYAIDFLAFCIRNPKPCPIVEVCNAGDPVPRLSAPTADLRTDVPSYRIYRDGRLERVVTDITEEWSADFVSVLLGCSYTFEWALMEHGLPIAHIEQGKVVPMYITGRECEPSGPFHGPMVVSMRPYPSHLISAVVAISQRFPSMHGAPVWIGQPQALGIADLASPDFGEAVTMRPDDIPVFWACGVTPQAVALQAGIPLMITHDPGHMFITDRLHSDYEV